MPHTEAQPVNAAVALGGVGPVNPEANIAELGAVMEQYHQARQKSIDLRLIGTGLQVTAMGVGLFMTGLFLFPGTALGAVLLLGGQVIGEGGSAIFTGGVIGEVARWMGVGRARKKK